MSDDVKDQRGDDGGPGSGLGPASGKGCKPKDRDLGHALRSVYGNTVKEDVPKELLDLLGKLD